MKLIVVTTMLFSMLTNAASLTTDPIHKRKTVKEKEHNNVLASRNFHSIKKWKMSIEFLNGDITSKIIKIDQITSSSAMELAFVEAEKQVQCFDQVKGYTVAPVSDNSFVLLAGGE